MAETQSQLSQSQLKDWRFSIDGEGIAWAIFDREGESANSLGRRPIQELLAIVERVEAEARNKTCKGLVIMSGKEKGFIVGADIREFETFTTEAQVIESLTPVNAMLDRIEKMPVPVVAAIHGVCVGGGLELILACHYRIATKDDSTRIGFPEVKLGIFPGFNGTARSIKQVGPMAAMQNMLTGGMIRAGAAKAAGLDRSARQFSRRTALGRAQGRSAEPQVAARGLHQGADDQAAGALVPRQEDARGNGEEGA